MQTADSTDLRPLEQEMFVLKREWSCFQSLFMHSDDRSRILFESLPTLAASLKLAVAFNTVVTLCRLVDERPDTLTLITLAKRLPPNPELDGAVAKLKSACKPIRVFRHKLIAHRDADISRGAAQLTPPQLSQVDEAVKLAESLTVQLGLLIDRGLLSFANADASANATLLHAYLAYGNDHREELLHVKRQLS